jgi:hypothetical protein
MQINKRQKKKGGRLEREGVIIFELSRLEVCQLD